MSGDLSGKTILITGGNVGIGRAVAFDLAKRKGTIVIVGRSEGSCSDAVEDIKVMTKNENVEYFVVDLADFKSIEGFVEKFAAKHNKVDVLVNNAGVWSPPVDTTAQGLEITMGINYLGHFYLTQLLGEYLVRSKALVVVLSSEAHKAGNITTELLDGDPPAIFAPRPSRSIKSDFQQYAISNRARIYFAKELSARYPEITAVSVHPGVVKTALNRNMCCLFRWLGCLFTPFLRSPEQGAETTIHCCTKDMRGNRGDYFVDCKPVELPADQVDGGIQRRLWEVTDELCKKLAK